MRVNLLDRVSFRGGRFVVSLEIDVPETHGELSGGESAHEWSENRHRFIQLRISGRFYLRTSNLRPLAMIARAMRRGENVPRSDQRPATPEFRTFRAVQEYRRHPRPTAGESLFSTDHSILTRVSHATLYRGK